MTIFLTAIGLFSLGLVLHLVLWRIRLPKYHTRTLLILFASLFLVWMAGWPFWKIQWNEGLHICLFYWGLCLCYIITYSAIEGDSPTLSLLKHLSDQPKGMSQAQVEGFFLERPFVNARLEALRHDGLVSEDHGKYFVAGKPSLFFGLILAFRRLYGQIESGG